MKIYISSRRNDAPISTSRIYDYLVTRIGKTNITMDMMRFGSTTDIERALRTIIGQCEAMLVIIGPKWLGVDTTQPRVSPWVQREVEIALSQNIRIIPILVDSASIPTFNDFAPSIQRLMYLNAVPVRPDPNFAHDMRAVASAIELGEAPSSQNWWSRLFGQRPAPALSLPDYPDEPPPALSEYMESEEPQASSAPKTIFISYKSEDRPAVSELASALSEAGYTVWYDAQLMGGHLWWDDILDHIRAYDLFLFILTPASVNSIPCQREFGYAAQLNKRILPLQLADGVTAELLPPALQKIQIVDYRESGGGLEKLREAFGALPVAAPLPTPLPAAPEAPISPLGAIKEQLDSGTIAREQQADIVLRLKALLQREDTAGGARLLLRQLAEHDDCRANIAAEIREILG